MGPVWRGVPVGCKIWEGVAAALLEETGADEPPQDAFELAECCGLLTRPWSRADGRLVGDTIWYPGRARHVRQHGSIAHEVAHWALAWADEADSEQGARYVAGALMLPRRGFDRDLRDTAWDLQRLRAKHLNVSAEMIARRLVELRDAVATVFDAGRVKRRIASPWLGDQFARVSTWERELADLALERGELVQGDELVWALPLLDGPWRRVVLVAEAQQLSLRL